MRHARRLQVLLVVVAMLPAAVMMACESSTNPAPQPAPTAPTPTTPPVDAGTQDSGSDANTDTGTPLSSYSIGGTLVNAAGAGLVLQNNGADDLTIPASATTFQFPIKITTGGMYAVTVKTLPAQQTCKVTAGTGTVGSADVTSVVVDCTSPASCKQIKTDFPALASGTYLVDPDGAGVIAPLPVYCDLSFDNGGWTLIESTATGLGPQGLTEGTVAPGSAKYLPLDTMKAFAAGASQVHIRSTGLAATESVTSVADMEPIANLRLGKLVNEGLVGTAQVDRWTGPFANADRLSNAGSTGSWPDVYWASSNFSGLHLVTTNSAWIFQTPNIDMEVYVR